MSTIQDNQTKWEMEYIKHGEFATISREERECLIDELNDFYNELYAQYVQHDHCELVAA